MLEFIYRYSIYVLFVDAVSLKKEGIAADHVEPENAQFTKMQGPSQLQKKTLVTTSAKQQQQ